MTDLDMGTWRYGYDLAGNLTSQTDAKGQTITFSYDALNRLTSKTGPGLSVTYGYDVGTYGTGRRTSMNDGSGSASWVYDIRGRTTQESKTITGVGTFVTA